MGGWMNCIAPTHIVPFSFPSSFKTVQIRIETLCTKCAESHKTLHSLMHSSIVSPLVYIPLYLCPPH